ncbi:MAG TPA: ABC-2 family transporter protein [Candidatus Limnocylindria bacterium]|nr:ABC-2 family transporter protein [Candidatus Limnocylindria bacterium]
MRAVRLAWVFFRVNALNELQYRANFFVQLMQSLIALVTGLAVIALVFSHTESLRGWTQPELLAVMGVHIIMGGLIGMAIQPNMIRLMEEVRDGKLDFALTKPADSQLLVSVREVRVWRVTDVIIGAVVLGYALSRLDAGVSPTGAVGFGLALLLGGLMIYCFWLILTTGAFWIVRMDELHELFEGVYQAGRWPVTIYPGWLRIGLTFLVPIAFAVTVPAQALTGRLTPETLLLAAGFALALLLFTRWWWRFGLRRYSGASA